MHSTEGGSAANMATEASAVACEASVTTTAESMPATVLGEGRRERQSKDYRRS
jgi:hypothetical protein